MKFHLDKKHLYWGLTGFLVMAASTLFIFAVFNYPVFAAGFSKILRVLTPIIYGFLLAYLMIPLVNLFEHRVFPWVIGKLNLKETPRRRHRERILSILLTLLVVIFLVTSFFYLVVPQIVSSIQTIIVSSPQYIRNLSSWSEQIFRDNPVIETFLKENLGTIETVSDNLFDRIAPYLNRIVAYVTSGIWKSLSFIGNLILGLIISIYVMSIKETLVAQAKKILFAFFSRKTARNLIIRLDFVNRTFNSYLMSSIMDSLIIGVICYISCLILGIPYEELVSVLVGVTNIIPFFGPYMGGIPCTIIVLMADPNKALPFVIMLLVLQQCDGNIIKPKLFGSSLGLSGLWVIVSILVGGGLFGIAGMFLGVPVFTVLYFTFKEQVNNRLVRRGLPTDTMKYEHSREMLRENREMRKRNMEESAGSSVREPGHQQKDPS